MVQNPSAKDRATVFWGETAAGRTCCRVGKGECIMMSEVKNKRKLADKERETLYKKQSGICNGCRNKYALKDLTNDHIKPFVVSQDNRLRNYQLLCTNCNSTKGTGTNASLRKKLIEKGILTKAKAKATKVKSTKTSTQKSTDKTKASQMTKKQQPELGSSAWWKRQLL